MYQVLPRSSKVLSILLDASETKCILLARASFWLKGSRPSVAMIVVTPKEKNTPPSTFFVKLSETVITLLSFN